MVLYPMPMYDLFITFVDTISSSFFSAWVSVRALPTLRGGRLRIALGTVSSISCLISFTPITLHMAASSWGRIPLCLKWNSGCSVHAGDDIMRRDAGRGTAIGDTRACRLAIGMTAGARPR
eukprot:07447_1